MRSADRCNDAVGLGVLGQALEVRTGTVVWLLVVLEQWARLWHD